jgi:hypothetical protein
MMISNDLLLDMYIEAELREIETDRDNLSCSKTLAYWNSLCYIQENLEAITAITR